MRTCMCMCMCMCMFIGMYVCVCMRECGLASGGRQRTLHPLLRAFSIGQHLGKSTPGKPRARIRSTKYTPAGTSGIPGQCMYGGFTAIRPWGPRIPQRRAPQGPRKLKKNCERERPEGSWDGVEGEITTTTATQYRWVSGRPTGERATATKQETEYWENTIETAQLPLQDRHDLS